jgi:type I restriction enzyme, R subunit
MTTVGQIERKTQARVVKLFREQLGYDYLGDWAEREGNRNVEEAPLRTFLDEQGYDEAFITRALHLLGRAAGDTSKSLYDRNRAVYELLRYGVKVKAEVGEHMETVWLIDWKHPEKNHFAIAEEVTVAGSDAKAYTKRPDVVLYVNGIALGLLELKRSTVSVGEGIRQNLDNQKKVFIEHFFSTVQWVMAGNDTEGLRYATIQTPEKYYLGWKEPSPIDNPLDRALVQLCGKARFLELIHDFIVFDAGEKKLCRHNQYFGVRAAQEHVKGREGGIIWHTQGSGKSLIMIWLAKWILEHVADARVLVITDRTELDEQIEGDFWGVGEKIYRTTSCADLIARLNATTPFLMCSLIHKFGAREDGEDVGDIPGYILELRKALPPGFAAKGNLFVFVAECHRTQSGDLHKAMKAILPGAVFIGFTGTPLLRADKQKSIEVFGRYIHTYKFDEAVKDGVVVDLRYEARDIDQRITSQKKIDQWFEAKTKGLTDLAKAQLKRRWGTMQTVLSSQSRLEQIVADIMMDMETRDRLKNGRGNALLVSSSIYQACKFYEMFAKTVLKSKCAIVTSYRPSPADMKGEESGEGLTERLRQYDIYKQMLADWFDEPAGNAVTRVEEFEKKVKEKFVKEPGQMKLLIVVDKLLTGFDAPPATYLYIDKQMRDHGLFQAICRVNRLDGDDKEYGYVVDYKDLFKSLEGAVHDYTSGALDGYDREDVAGLLADRLGKARERLEEARETVRGDYIDLKMYEPAMRHLIDTYIKADESEKVSAFDDLSLVQLIVERGAAAIDALPDGIRKSKDAVAEAIENNVRRLIIDEQPINPKYYEKMSQLLDALIEQRRREALDYQEYLRRIVELTKQVTSPEASGAYSAALSTPGRRALYDNLDRDEELALAIDAAVRSSRQDDWRSNAFKVRRVRNAIRTMVESARAQGGVVGESPAAYVALPSEPLEQLVERILALVKNQDEY